MPKPEGEEEEEEEKEPEVGQSVFGLFCDKHGLGCAAVFTLV